MKIFLSLSSSFEDSSLSNLNISEFTTRINGMFLDDCWDCLIAFTIFILISFPLRHNWQGFFSMNLLLSYGKLMLNGVIQHINTSRIKHQISRL